MRRLLFPVLAFLALFAIPAMAQDQIQGLPPRAAPTAHVQVQQLAVVDATPNFDPARATAAYLARVNGAARAKSDAYFEGGYWLSWWICSGFWWCRGCFYGWASQPPFATGRPKEPTAARPRR